MTEQRTDGAAGTTSADYSAFYFDGHLGPPYTYEEPHWKQFFGAVADAVVATFAPARTYDAGCAIGLFVRALLERGVDARGGDISEFAVAGAPDGLRERLEVRDLTRPFTERYDLVSCIEVLEHMSPPDAQRAIGNLCAAADTLLISSTPDDFTEPTHINVRTPASWAADFARHGFFRRTDVDASFLSPWAVVYEKAELTPVELVARYEALVSPLSREVVAKRQALLETQRDLDRLQQTGGPEREELAQQVHDLQAAVELAERERAEVTADRDRVVDDLVELRDGGDHADQLVRLGLVDELIGLRAELTQARLRSENAYADAQVQVDAINVDLASVHADLHHSRLQEQQLRAELDRLHAESVRQLSELRASATWKFGRLVMAPVAVPRRFRRRR
ncbi:class I SAM-dependent methyltransferase [uncultured Modestobacter sp.]|uniref:class I SAM-dependent methyltransferase n=1 Tax=uncultured Modestobacter sp. TaxID=380048 RepID=UPI0026150E9E|nr:methyltransferase domain-containing protein [uncultured Modestobacter sp.]